ncbi:MAG: arylsulfatase [Bacteroidales bacterium]
MRHLTFTLTLFAAFCCSNKTINAQETNTPPNIILILADDFGFGSLNCYGADHDILRTPYIDQIADKGMKFTNAYATASVCTPTRYSLLMGEYSWRSKLKHGVWGVESPLLPDPEKMTIADWFKDRGYNTACIGKWHLGYGKTGTLEEYTGTLKPGPLDLGFDYHFGVPQNHGDKMGVFIENDHIYGIRSDKINPYSRAFYGPQYYGFDAPQRKNIETMEDLTDKTIEWLSKQSRKTPVFLYFAPVAVHHPITPSNYMRGMSDSGPYGDFIQDLDWSVGRILQTLEYKGMLENSLVIFTSDNGGEIPGNKPTSPEIQAVEMGLKINGDFRGDKHTIWEGGTRIPLIVSWPGKVKEGAISDDVVSTMDIFATVADIIGGGLPADKAVASDSYSFYSSLVKQENRNLRTSLITIDAVGRQAIRMGDWKLIDNKYPESLPENRKGKKLEYELYNLAEDMAESKNLFVENQKIARKMITELEKLNKENSSR